MVTVYIHPTVDAFKARVLVGESVSLKIESKAGDVIICGDKKSADALRMIADMFNDAFAPKPVEPDSAAEKYWSEHYAEF